MDLCKLHCIQVTCIITINGNETPLWMVKNILVSKEMHVII